MGVFFSFFITRLLLYWPNISGVVFSHLQEMVPLYLLIITGEDTIKHIRRCIVFLLPTLQGLFHIIQDAGQFKAQFGAHWFALLTIHHSSFERVAYNDTTKRMGSA